MKTRGKGWESRTILNSTPRQLETTFWDTRVSRSKHCFISLVIVYLPHPPHALSNVFLFSIYEMDILQLVNLTSNNQQLTLTKVFPLATNHFSFSILYISGYHLFRCLNTTFLLLQVLSWTIYLHALQPKDPFSFHFQIYFSKLTSVY